MGTFPVPGTSFRNTERKHYGTSFLNTVERESESYARVIIGTSVPNDYGTSSSVCAYCTVPVHERPAKNLVAN